MTKISKNFKNIKVCAEETTHVKWLNPTVKGGLFNLGSTNITQQKHEKRGTQRWTALQHRRDRPAPRRLAARKHMHDAS